MRAVANPWRDPARAERFLDQAIAWNPTRPEQVEILLSLAGSPGRVLDAGCGPGFFAERLLERGAEVTVLDFSEAMLDRARERLGERVRYVLADLDGDWSAAGDGFDLVLAVQCVHHLDDDGKRRAMGNAHRALRPGGLYLQSDPVAVVQFEQCVALWNRARVAAGFEALPETFDVAEREATLARNGDLLAPLGAQLEWLREAGFDPAVCFWCYADRAIFGGRRCTA